LLFLGGLSPREQKIFRLAALAIIIPPLANLSRRPCVTLPVRQIEKRLLYIYFFKNIFI
jgi:hypothetical protein